MNELGDAISLISGAALACIALLVMRAYSPRSWSGGDGANFLAIAIFLGFAAALGNTLTLYWQVFGQIAVNTGLISVRSLRFVGDILDGVFKGGAALAGYLHLKALHVTLTDNERARWGVLEMAFYPNRRRCLKLMTKLLRRARR